jgi:hypothetical protein
MFEKMLQDHGIIHLENDIDSPPDYELEGVEGTSVLHHHYCDECADNWSHDTAECADGGYARCPEHE